MVLVTGPARTDVASLLEEMLTIPSPTGMTDAMTEWLRARSDELGFRATVEQGNVVAEWGTGSTEVMLVGHLDTVPGDLPVRRTERALYGRGAVDAKGPLAAAIIAITRQPREGSARFTLVAVPDEEGPSLGARHLRARPSPDHLIVLEPSGWDAVTVGYRGAVTVSVRMDQALAHRAGPDPGAADRLIAHLAEMTAYLRGRWARASAFQRCTMNVISLSTTCDGIRDIADATVHFRLPVEFTTEDLEQLLRARWGGMALSFHSRVDAVHLHRSNDTARGLAQAIRAAGGTPRYKVKTGTADLNVLAPHWGCAAAAYGPGDSHLDHTPDEHVDIDELERGADVLTAALHALIR